MKTPRSRVTAAAIIITAALSVAGCSASPSAPSSSTDETLTIGTFAAPTSLDPALATLSAGNDFTETTYDSLILQKPNGSIAPMLATKWVYSDGNKKLALTLRSGVKFSDGTTFNSSVALKNLEHYNKVNGAGSVLAPITAMADPNPTILNLTLSAPDPSLLIDLSNMPGFMVSAKALGTPALKTAPDGTGPYTLDAAGTVTGSKYTFDRKANYWGTALPYKHIVFQIIPDETARLNALKSGQLNAALFNQVSSVTEAQNSGLTPVANYSINWQGLLLYDRGGSMTPALGNVKVRRAINYAIDRKLLLSKLLLGKGAVTNQIFAPGDLGYVPALDNAYPYNPAKAKKLLAEAGYPNGFTMTEPEAPSILGTAIYAAIHQDLGAVGIKIVPTPANPASFFGNMAEGKYSSTFMQFVQPSDWGQVKQYIAPTAVWNPFHTSDPKLNALIAQVQSSTSTATQAKDYKAINTYIVQQAWFSIFFRVDQLWVHDKNTTVIPQAQNADPAIYSWAPAK